MSKDDKKPRNALKQLFTPEPEVAPSPPAPKDERPRAKIAKLVQGAGPSALTSVIVGTHRVADCIIVPAGLVVLTRDPDDEWFTPWANVIWYRPA